MYEEVEQYLLGSKPSREQWTDAIRVAFLQGLSSFHNLLGCMQGMETVTRQVVQHMEFEPEWEAAFQLHNKLSPVISLIIDWCGSDRVILIKAFRATLSKLQTLIEENQTAVRELADHSATCIQYDVATKPVSIHLQVSRFLAGLYLHLEKYGLSFDSPEFQFPAKPSPEQIIEPVLRTQVMIAQVHSGMWKRNGYSLLNQVFSYHSVQYRSEMLDRDIVILQMGASLIQSDEFLIHLLNKFNLIEWADPAFEETSFKNPEEDHILQTICLVEEFLGLVIAIVGERYVPGVGKVTHDDQIKKEIIQKLCIRPMAHSELNKTLPKDVHHETGLDRVIDDVAQFNKPSGSTRIGVYELKPEFYDQYNMYSYHYTREELSKSEEEQRKRRENANELVCCPPPKLPPLTEAFSMIPNLLQCDVMLHIMQTVLKRSINLQTRSFSEHQLQKVLHLIGYALQEEESKQYPCLLFTEKSKKWNIKKLVKDLSTSPRVEALKDMLTWTLNKFKQVEATKENAEVSATPVFAADTSGSVKENKAWRAQMAAEKRAKIMAHIAAMQKNFMKENAKLFEETVSYPEKTSECSNAMDFSEEDERDPIALGPNQTSKSLVEKTFTCILCQEDSTVTVDGPTLVLSAFVQRSTVHANSRSGMEKPDQVLTIPLFLPTSRRPQPHTSTCSHVMHSLCWQKYFENVLAKESRRQYRLRTPMSFDVERQEFLCPLCECLSNTVLPLLPPLGLITPKVQPSSISFELFVDGLEIALNQRRRKQTKEEEGKDAEAMNMCSIEKVQKDMGADGAEFAALFSQEERPQLSGSLVDMIQLFAEATYAKGLDVHPTSNSSVLLMAWNTCYYTILSIERLLADQEKPLFGMLSSRQKDCLESLTRFAGVLGALWKDPHVISSHTLYLLSMILDGNSKTQELPCLLDWDSFGLLVPLTLSIPNLFYSKQQKTNIPSGGVLELHVLTLVFLSHVTRILLTTKFQSGEEDMETDETSSTLSQTEAELVLDSLLNVKKSCNYDVMDVTQLDANYVWATVKRLSVPFLRCCALFYNFLTDVQHPPCLTEPGGDTYENLCKYLGLPVTAQELFETSKYKPLSTMWVTHERIPGYLATQSFAKQPTPVNGLVPLPHDYSELINMIATFMCPNSEKEDARYPTMCLVCGEMLCSQSYCCQRELGNISVGACTYHAYQCGASCGIFLRIRECEILLLATPSRGCFIQAPYLDRYGETDPGLRRGNPLTLCPIRYQKMKLLWLSHGLHEEITRAIESSTNVITTQWQHL
ncbi:UNVERIFIED_CONTAM: hypothetical protein PYX00_005659 [Menopon gallinae]|uniref:E3 ubiquitin-protein ligase n=1 Tax=Menopon gallinae TaxID=328185 RepID=A0AAW2HSB3_9NEOP